MKVYQPKRGRPSLAFSLHSAGNQPGALPARSIEDLDLDQIIATLSAPQIHPGHAGGQTTVLHEPAVLSAKSATDGLGRAAGGGGAV